MSDVTSIVTISDTHCGCRFGLFPRQGFSLDKGMFVEPTRTQVAIADAWDYFWTVWVPRTTRGGRFILVHNGDTVEGVHHHATSQITHNMNDQRDIAVTMLAPVVRRAEAFYVVRGTPVHDGECGEHAEAVARELGAIPDEAGNYSRDELFLRLGDALVHFSHHTTSGKASARVEYEEMLADSAKNSEPAPGIIVRSHVHYPDYYQDQTGDGHGFSIVTPAWQAKTPFAHRVRGGRTKMAKIGGVVINQGDEEFYSRTFTRTLPRPETVHVGDGGKIER